MAEGGERAGGRDEASLVSTGERGRLALWIGLSVLLFQSLLWFPLVGFFVGFLTPLPSSLALYRWGMPRGLVVPGGSLLCGAVMLSMMGAVGSLPYFAIFLLMGGLIGLYGRRRLGVNATVGIATVVGFAAGLILFWWRTHEVEGSVWDRMGDRLFDLVMTLLGSVARDDEPNHTLRTLTPYLEEQIRHTLYVVVRLLPGVSFASLLLTASVNAVLTKEYATRRALPVPPWPPATLWRAPDWIVWGVIVAGVASLFPSTRLVGLNGLIACGVVPFLQGIAIFLFFAERWRLPRWLSAVMLFLLLMQQYLVIALALLGLFDVWIDLRGRTTRSTLREKE